MAGQKHLLGNSPINNFEEDLFNFKHYAEKVKKIIQLNSSNTEPITIGIYGKWGEGKTSFLNLLKHKIEHFNKDENGKEYLIYDFNPWRYSNEDEMLFDFFDGIAKKFYVKKVTSIQEVGKFISKYSKYLKAIKISATVGIPKLFNKKVEFDVNKVFEALGEDLTGEKISLDFFKDKINETIKKVNFKVIVFVDDLDRLDKNEIYTILKLIKLNANFDNFIFITTLDSEHVAKAIKERYGNNDEDGKLFLEKIINIPIHLPKIEEEDLQYFFETRFNQIIKHLDSEDYSKKESELKEIVQGFSASRFNSPREIIRVLNSFFIGAFGFEDEINLKDLFWIEWIKVKNEELYSEIKKYNPFGLESIFNGQNVIINFNDDFEYGLQPNNNAFVVGEILNGTRKELVNKFPKYKEIIDLLFPNKKASEVDTTIYDNNLNINSVYHFNKYFSFHTERKVKNASILKIKELIKNRNPIDLITEIKLFFSKDTENHKALYSFENVIRSLTSTGEKEFLFNFLFENIELIPDSQRDMFDEDFRLRMVEFIAVQLNNNNIEGEIIIELAKKLKDLDQLLRFSISFDKEKDFVKDLELLFLENSKQNMSDEIAFYKDSENILNRWFLEFWNKYKPDEFKQYIEKSLSDIDSIKHLIRNFSVIFNGKKFGPLSKEKFNFMKKSIDVDFLYNKIYEYEKILIESVDIKNFVFDNYDESTLDHNIKQFIYWYLYEKNQNDKIDKILS